MPIRPEIKKAIEDDCLVVFAGAGTSIPLDLPSWNMFVLKVLSDVQKVDKTYQHFEDLIDKKILTPLQVLEALKPNRLYRKLVIQNLKKELKKIKNLQEFPLQSKILQLTRKVITTNYDQAFESVAKDLNVILKDEKSHLSKIFNKDEFLWKIHGDIVKAKQCVLYNDQYEKLYDKNGPFLLGLKILFIQKTVLFVGFSLTDPYIEELIKTMDELYQFHNRKPFVIIKEEYAGLIEKKYGDSIICIPIKEHKDLSDILNVYIQYKEEGIDYTKEDVEFARSYQELIGRDEQLIKIMDSIVHPAPVTVIKGPAGIGKTSLALEIAHICLDKSKKKLPNTVRFDFVVWIYLDKYAEPNLLYSILDQIGKQTDYDNIMRAEGLEKKKRAVRQLFQEKKVLIVFDNFEDTKNVELNDWIRRIRTPTEVLITTQQDVDLTPAVYTLQGLEEKDSIKFLRKTALHQSFSLGEFDTEENLRKIHVATSGNPQTLKLAIGYIKHGLVQLSDLSKTDSQLKKIFAEEYSKPWKNLSSQAKKVASIFIVFGYKNHVHRNALHYISEMHKKDFNEALGNLLDWNLLIVNIPDQTYTIHPSFLIFLENVLQMDNSQ